MKRILYLCRNFQGLLIQIISRILPNQKTKRRTTSISKQRKHITSIFQNHQNKRESLKRGWLSYNTSSTACWKYSAAWWKKGLASSISGIIKAFVVKAFAKHHIASCFLGLIVKASSSFDTASKIHFIQNIITLFNTINQNRYNKLKTNTFQEQIRILHLYPTQKPSYYSIQQTKNQYYKLKLYILHVYPTQKFIIKITQTNNKMT